MKRINVIFAILLLVMAGCGRNKQSDNKNDDVITVNVTASYPNKELILQDFMDVEYILLEDADEFITQGIVRDVGKNFIIVTNSNQVNDGDILFFGRNGKGLRKINRKGQGGEEYTFILGITLDEENNEIFVNDHMTRRIIVYDLYGKFKRTIKSTKEGVNYYSKIFNYNNDNLICFDNYFPGQDEEIKRNSFYIVSKQDGSIKELEIPFKKKISTIMMVQRGEYTLSNGPRNCQFMPFQTDWIIAEASSDTVYKYKSDDSMFPFIVRTPSVQSMEPIVFLFPGVLTDNYYFMQTTKMEYDFDSNKGFPSTDLVYDTQEKTIFNCTVYNDDYTNKRPVNMFQDPVNEDVVFWQRLEAYQLIESYGKNELKGKLKEFAVNLNEESNPVIMVVKNKR
jgi:hypothetical protein